MKIRSFERKAIIGLLALNLIITFVFVVIPKVEAAAGCFPDTNGHWAEEFICWMSDNAITGGYPDGTFQPENRVTRAELAVFLSNFSDFIGPTGEGNYYTEAEVDALLAAQASQIADLNTLLASMSLENGGQDVVFSGVNVHVRDGSGDTNGSVNGLGNLIVGYNEDAGADAVRTGSHNLVVGIEHSYFSYGGFVTGENSTISGPYTAVSGGRNNTASQQYASISGGAGNTASGSYSSVSGGYGNTSSGSFSSISAGNDNTSSGTYTSVTGGEDNIASGTRSSVSGGQFNVASGNYSSVLGGGSGDSSYGNEAWAHYSMVVGGRNNTAGDDLGTDRSIGEGSTVLAGYANKTKADYASVSAGYLNTAWGNYSSISGGYNNYVSGSYSTVSGGLGNAASGYCSSVSGGVGNTASGGQSSVSGGDDNTASGISATVCGGYDNLASGDVSSVSGGWNRSVTGTYDWRAGTLFQDQ